MNLSKSYGRSLVKCNKLEVIAKQLTPISTSKNLKKLKKNLGIFRKVKGILLLNLMTLK